MEYVTNLMDTTIDTVAWARRREAQGWHVLSVADHFFTATRPFPHVWVTAGVLATATTRPLITTAFVNNLLRSPVEVAQAGLMMQHVSAGRFELGLGAGWLREEIVAAGLRYPEPRDRAGAFAEAVQIVRELLHKGTCRFQGEYYDVDVPLLGPVSDHPPVLVASVGGPRTVREVTPHVDRVEIKASSPSTRGGSIDLAAMARIPDDHLREMVDRVRAVRPDVELGMFVFCNAADDERTRQMHAAMGDGLYRRFYGPPEHVAEGLAWLAEQGISRAQLSPLDDSSFDRLAPLLL
jgi:alkanesulfonate monooxygenase SsuD/methylene tetrahydromethanopterin reductase-like flavin-dependent oxidoreductase (luciferase family)